MNTSNEINSQILEVILNPDLPEDVHRELMRDLNYPVRVGDYLLARNELKEIKRNQGLFFGSIEEKSFPLSVVTNAVFEFKIRGLFATAKFIAVNYLSPDWQEMQRLSEALACSIIISLPGREPEASEGALVKDLTELIYETVQTLRKLLGYS